MVAKITKRKSIVFYEAEENSGLAIPGMETALLGRTSAV